MRRADAGLPIAVFAVIYLLKYLSTDLHADDGEKELARNHISTAYQIFIRYTASKSHSTAAKLIELLGSRTATELSYGLSRDTSHFGSSICYDAFLEAERLRSELENAKNPSQVTGDEPVARIAPRDNNASTSVLGSSTIGPDDNVIIPPLHADGGWGFPWGIWDDFLLDDAQLVMDMGAS